MMAEASSSFNGCCKLSFDSSEPVHVTKKGALTLLSYSEKHEREDLIAHLNHCINTNCFESILVHPCRRDFTNPKQLTSSQPAVDIPPAKRLATLLFTNITRSLDVSLETGFCRCLFFI